MDTYISRTVKGTLRLENAYLVPVARVLCLVGIILCISGMILSLTTLPGILLMVAGFPVLAVCLLILKKPEYLICSIGL
jgi:hypothetical protein